jgi:hypothetical protein
LVRFPRGFDVADMSTTAKALEQQVGVHTVGVAEAEKEDRGLSTDLPEQVTGLLERAQTAYKELNLTLALEILEPAEALCLSHAVYSACQSFLFEADLLRGMALDAMGNKEAAAQSFRSAHIALPTRVADPRRYPPDIIRAFAKACADVESAGAATVALSSDPEGASFRADGVPVASPEALSLTPGRHIVASELLGFEDAWQRVDVDASGVAPSEVRFALTPLPHVDAWKALVAHISTPGWRPTDPGLDALLDRFKIDAVILLERGPAGVAGLVAKIAVSKDAQLQELPSPGAPGAPISEAFTVRVKENMGLEVTPVADPDPTATVSPPPPEAHPPEAHPDGEAGKALGDQDENEDPSVRFLEGDKAEGDEEAGTGAKLLKSPWFWISIGIVTAIVTGVVVATQVGD